MGGGLSLTALFLILDKTVLVRLGGFCLVLLMVRPTLLMGSQHLSPSAYHVGVTESRN